jgi:riboflavin kinase/FMN adenylyltransferase
LYGQDLTVELVGFLRPERRFAHLEALKAQIARDIAAAEKALF